MADIKYYDVILKPVITEKSMNAMGEKNIHSWFIRKQTSLRSKRLLRKCSKGTKVKKRKHHEHGMERKNVAVLQLVKQAKTKKSES